LDTAWLILFVVAYIGLRHSGHVSLPWLFGAWCGTGAAVGLYALWNHSSQRGVRSFVKFWYRSEHSVGLRFAGQTLITTSWTYIVINLFILIFSISVIGQFKLAQLVFGPVTVMVAGVLTAMIAQASRVFAVDSRRALRFVAAAGLVTAVVTLVWAALVYEAPVHTMTKILGPTWPTARHLVPAMGLALALATVAQSATTGLRSIRAAKQSLRLVMCMVPVLLTFCMGAGTLWGVEAALLALSAGYLIYVVAGWTLLVRTVHRLRPDAGGAPGPGNEEELVVDGMLELAEP
jgi:O-antigen/teichoic acid export membrane protein